ncbi:hypothetical protein LAZ67_X000139 [Cordylochernes scorpioides]|uniref:HTH psq-type domain-containing protein n=1 Tax=Cordylochernes scorpioides TaxID=51811 RepID=A0ABY6LUI6_9ARAC|nr:hypothetical protein LAZ67_X000139 [Cordylochernes scorpioides]
MDRKKVCKKSSAKKNIMSIELKREIIEKHEQGVRVVDLSRQYGRSTSMICSVLKRKESIKSVTPAKGLTIISKLRTSLHENMEKLLMVRVFNGARFFFHKFTLLHHWLSVTFREKCKCRNDRKDVAARHLMLQGTVSAVTMKESSEESYTTQKIFVNIVY